MALPLFLLTRGALRAAPFLSRLVSKRPGITASEALKRVRAAGIGVSNEAGGEIIKRLKEGREVAETVKNLGLNLVPRLSSIPRAPGKQFAPFRAVVELRSVGARGRRGAPEVISVISEGRLSLQEILDEAQTIVAEDYPGRFAQPPEAEVVAIFRRP